MTDTRLPHVAVERVTPQYWRATFDHGPINTTTAHTVAELSRVVDEIERDGELTVVVFTSRRVAALAAHGYGQDGELERRLGELVTPATAPPDGKPSAAAHAAGAPR